MDDDSMRSWQLDFEHDELSPMLARHTLHEWMTEIRCPDDVKLDAAIVVSELVTNAVASGSSYVRLVVTFDGGRLRLETYDDHPHPATLAAISDDVPRQIIEALTDAWGWTANEAGTHVWTERLL